MVEKKPKEKCQKVHFWGLYIPTNVLLSKFYYDCFWDVGKECRLYEFETDFQF